MVQLNNACAKLCVSASVRYVCAYALLAALRGERLLNAADACCAASACQLARVAAVLAPAVLHGYARLLLLLLLMLVWLSLSL